MADIEYQVRSTHSVTPIFAILRRHQWSKTLAMNTCTSRNHTAWRSLLGYSTHDFITSVNYRTDATGATNLITVLPVWTSVSWQCANARLVNPSWDGLVKLGLLSECLKIFHNPCSWDLFILLIGSFPLQNLPNITLSTQRQEDKKTCYSGTTVALDPQAQLKGKIYGLSRRLISFCD